MKTINELNEDELLSKIKNLYHTKDTFSFEEADYISQLIDSYELYTCDINDIIMEYIYNELEINGFNYEEHIVWQFTDENISNSKTGKENYLNLIEYLQEIN